MKITEMLVFRGDTKIKYLESFDPPSMDNLKRNTGSQGKNSEEMYMKRAAHAVAQSGCLLAEMKLKEMVQLKRWGQYYKEVYSISKNQRERKTNRCPLARIHTQKDDVQARNEAVVTSA